VEVENTKGEKGDAEKVYKMMQQHDFRRILESKVDHNVKTAKLLSNQMRWVLDYENAKTTKYTILLPINGFVSSTAQGPKEEFKTTNLNPTDIHKQEI
jgi:outer membrane PBP1 activator LpoA protein